MIFSDRVGIVCKTKEASGSTAPVIEKFNGTVPALVVPMSAAKLYSDSGVIVTINRFNLIIKPFAYLIPLNASNAAPSAAGSNQILFSYGGYPSLSLSLETKIERHLLRGRLHHYEAIVRTV